MRSHLGPFLCSLALGAVAIGGSSIVEPTAANASLACAGATVTTTAASSLPTTETINRDGAPPEDAPDSACWVEQSYPFGPEGEPVSSSNCPSKTVSCYLTVTSMDFRAWNRGLAATREESGGPAKGAGPFGVWIFNGAHWLPSPGFPGNKLCSGNTVVWAGKRDYWLVGGKAEETVETETTRTEKEWAHLCRFDGEHLEWEPLGIPEATKEHVAEEPPKIVNGKKIFKLRQGTITSAACFAWNNCWFFGTYGTVIHWDGHILSDASPDPSEGWLLGEYTGAVVREGPFGERFGAVVGATSEGESGKILPAHGGAGPPQLYESTGGLFSPTDFEPPTTPQTGDPYRTDLIGVDLDSSGEGWVAGNPAGLRLGERDGFVPGEPSPSPRAPAGSFSPLVPISPLGASATCPGPPPGRFTYTPPSAAAAEVFLWSSIAVLPNGEASGAALAGGRWREAKAGSSQTEVTEGGEPVIASANCAGTTRVTRFVNSHEPPADREGGVTAIAANADNDAWAATSKGQLVIPETVHEPPHLYRLTNGRPVEAAEGNDEEALREVPQEDAPTIVIEPPQPEPPPEPPVVVPKTQTITLPAAVYDVKARVHKLKRHGHLYLSLYLTFRLNRPVTIGAHALRRGHVVSVAKPRLFAGSTGLLILKLNRRHWPTKVNFTS